MLQTTFGSPLITKDGVTVAKEINTHFDHLQEITPEYRKACTRRAIRMFVVDAPHGGGKISVQPTYVASQSPTHTVLGNYEGMLIAYPEPRAVWQNR
jgi:L-lysine 2,3-aminomutase